MVATYQFQDQIGFGMPIIEIFLMVVLGFTVGPMIAGIVGKPVGSLYAGTANHQKIPLLSEAESAAKRQEYVRASELYRSAQQEFPHYLPLYQPLFDLLINKLHDTDTARMIYRSGWNVLSGEERKKLSHLFNEFKKEG